MIADIIHIAAISELQALFCDHILTREHVSDVEKRIEAREAEWHASIKEVEARETEAIRSVRHDTDKPVSADEAVALSREAGMTVAVEGDRLRIKAAQTR